MVDAFQRIAETLIEFMGRESVKIDPEHTARYAVDGIAPKAVVFPADIEQVAKAVKFANRERMAIIPWGSGTKVGIGNPPDHLDVVVSTARLNQMTDVDTANLTMTVQAGVRIKDIQTRLVSEENRCYLPMVDPVTEAEALICSDRENTGCFFPLDPMFGDQATIGGVVAGNTSGPRRLLYGLPRDLVLGVRFVAPNGDIIGTGGKTVKNVSGYDVSKLMIGSWGTLGILCEMTLRLLPLPERMETLRLVFSSLSDAEGFIDRLFETKLLPAAVEILNERAFKRLGVADSSATDLSNWLVAVALEGCDEAVDRMRTELQGMAGDFGAGGTTHLPEDAHREFWQKVSNLEISLATQFPGMITLKLNYPISQWKKVISMATGTLNAYEIDHALLAHAGNGICIINLLMGEGIAATKDKRVQAVDALFHSCREMGGNLLVQRAPVVLKPHLPIWGDSGPHWRVMKWIREQLDPNGIMSPGRLLR